MKIIIPGGIKIGHAQDDRTGVTVVLAEKGCAAGCDVRGGAPGTRETALLRPEKAVQKVHAVVLCGGSAYGLNACGGVMEYLRERNIGLKTGRKVVPIVTGAVIYDLNSKEYRYPTAEMGYEACENAKNTPEFGQKGVGRGATVGKLRGIEHACKSGIGAYTVKICGITVTAAVVVNSLGDVVENGEIIAGAKGKDGKFIDSEKTMAELDLKKIIFGANTTLGCVMTNAKLTKLQANKLASAAHNGLARSIRPVHTDYDGDTIFALATGKIPVVNLTLLEVAAVKAVEGAVINAVKSGAEYSVIYDETEDFGKDDNTEDI